jgi:hypothetical protein
MRQPAREQQPIALRMPASRSLNNSLTLLVAVCAFMSGCAKPERPKEQEPLPQPRAEATQLPQISTLPQPKLNEVQEAVKRVFKDSALIDTSRNPNFIVGDFNGDASQDVAVVLKPAPTKLSEMNEEMPPWILKDPFATSRPGMSPLRVAENELLLAVIHGYGPNGWRNPQATQTYLLKNAVGSGVETHAKAEFVAANAGRKLPRLRGDLIAEVLRGTQGYLYYDEASYSWYDPKTFKGEPERRLVHSGVALTKEK